MKEFNTITACIPSKHYMVDISDKVGEIKKLVDAGKYFCINRARQYGKTTTLTALETELSSDYSVLSLDFQEISKEEFKNEVSFVKAFSKNVIKEVEPAIIPSNIIETLKDFSSNNKNAPILDELFMLLTDWCNASEKPVVMIIDEVDSATNLQILLDFLAQIRLQYIEREKYSDYKTFHSVILAGVTDINRLTSMLRPEDVHKINYSPFNIAADFNVDMSLSQVGIKGMLDEYEADHNIGIDTAAIAKEIHTYTSGYPFLVSRICELIDKDISRKMSLLDAWSRTGIDEAKKLVLSENSTLFQSIKSQ